MTKLVQKSCKVLHFLFLIKKPLKRLPRLGGFFARTEMLQDTAGSLKKHNPSIIKQLDFSDE